MLLQDCKLTNQVKEQVYLQIQELFRVPSVFFY